MEPSPYSDIRTIWFSHSYGPHADTDYEMLLERSFDQLTERSISKFQNLWNPDACEEQGMERPMTTCKFLSPSSQDERTLGHYCIIKPLSTFVQKFLREICEPYGYIVETKIRKSKVDGQMTGVVDFKDKENAQRAAKAIDGSSIGDGVVLSAHYVSKEKRPKTLDIISNRQTRTTVENKKPFVQQSQPNSDDYILSELCQQWAFFSEMHGKSTSLDALIVNLKSNMTPAKTTIYKPVESKRMVAGKEIQEILKDLENDPMVHCSRKLLF